MIDQLIAAHPVASHVVAVLAGAVGWHGALTWVETTGVDRAVAWLKARQGRAAAALGVPPAQVQALLRAEAAAAARAADDLAKNSTPPACG